MKIYVAGPMTGIKDFNFPMFAAATAALRACGYEVVNPAELNAGSDGDWLNCMRRDIAELVSCDGVATLPGWMVSRGAKIEVNLASGLGLKVASWTAWATFEPSRIIAVAA